MRASGDRRGSAGKETEEEGGTYVEIGQPDNLAQINLPLPLPFALLLRFTSHLGHGGRIDIPSITPWVKAIFDRTRRMQRVKDTGGVPACYAVDWGGSARVGFFGKLPRASVSSVSRDLER